MNIVDKILKRIGYVKANRTLGIDVENYELTAGISGDPQDVHYLSGYEINAYLYRGS